MAARAFRRAYARNATWSAAVCLSDANAKETTMATEAEIEDKFWKALKSDMTVMLGIEDHGEDLQPMTAQLEGDDRRGPIWFFTSKETDLARDLGGGQAAVIAFAAKSHSLFATVHGDLVADNDRAMIDKLWTPFVAAWFEGGKDDPKLQLLRFDPSEAKIWLNENSLFAGVRILLGRDPKKDYGDKVAEVRL
jgi:general stress protein 26